MNEHPTVDVDQDESKEAMDIIMPIEDESPNKYQIILSLKDLEKLQKKVESDLYKYKLVDETLSLDLTQKIK